MANTLHVLMTVGGLGTSQLGTSLVRLLCAPPPGKSAGTPYYQPIHSPLSTVLPAYNYSQLHVWEGMGRGNGSISKVLKIDLHHFPLIM